jgi:hypothetical protein
MVSRANPEHIEQHSTRQTAQRVVESRSERNAHVAAQGRAEYSRSLFGDARLHGRGNQSVQVAMMQQMQQTYGNRAVQRFMQSGRQPMPLQRDPTKPGWSGTTGPNAGETRSAKPGDSIRRIPLDGLTKGYQKEGKHGHTAESAAGRAIVLMPQSLDVNKPVEVLLHLHGWGVGYRLRTKPHEDNIKGLEQDTVRDVAIDKTQAQLEASGRKQMIGVLPQGGTHSEFGDKFNSDDYLRDLFRRLEEIGVWPKGKDLEKSISNVVLSGHSGAGGTILGIESNKGMVRDKSRLPNRIGRLAEVVLFDAINGEGQLKQVTIWALAQLNADLKASEAQGTPDEQVKYIQSTGMRFRAYYTPSSIGPKQEKKDGKKVWLDEEKKKPKFILNDDGTPKMFGYAVDYPKLKTAIDNWFSARAKETVGGKKAHNSDVLAAMRANYEVSPVAKGVRHEQIIGANDKLKEALGALPAAKP